MIHETAKRRFAASFVLVFSTSLAFSYVTYEAPPAPRINVRWSAHVTSLQQRTVEATYHLTEPDHQEGRTWSYAILDTSTDNLRRLVQDPAAEDTHWIDRATFELSEPPPAPLFVLSGFLALSSLLAIVAAAFFTWMGPERWKLLFRVPTMSLAPLWSAGRRWSQAALDAGSAALAPLVWLSTSLRSAWRQWSQSVLDVGSGALAPLVVFVVLFDDVVATNVRELLYQPQLVRSFHAVAVVTAGAGVWIVRRSGPRMPARLWLMMPWAVLLLDVVGAALQASPIGLAAIVDALVIAAVVVLAARVPWRELQTVATLATVAFMIMTGMTHVALIRGLAPDLIANRPVERTPEPRLVPRANTPGNVYHILLDNYLAESYASLADTETRDRLAGFTFFSRFNAQFPRTSSSEPALLHGRLPTPGISVSEWPNIALREGFWRDLDSAGLGVWVYPYGRWLCPDYAAACIASSDVEQQAQATLALDATIDLWVLRLMPASVRRVLSTRSAAQGEERHAVGYSLTATLRTRLGWETPQRAPASPLISANPGQYFNLKQFDQLLADEPSRPARGQYVYYHALIPHPLYLLDDRCEPHQSDEYTAARYFDFARCANRMVARLVDVLAQLGRLDDALIIVHSDHGDAEFLIRPQSPHGTDPAFALDPVARRYQEPDSTYQDDTMFDELQNGDSAKWRSIAVEVFSSALLLVKFPHTIAYSEDTRPVQLLDIAPTILSHFGAATASYDGTTIPRVPKTRDEVFYAHSRQFDGKFSKYRLGAGGWEFVENLPVEP